MNIDIRTARLEYFDWLCEQVLGDQYGALSYGMLLQFLHSINYTWVLERDQNRASYGVRLRYIFGNEVGYGYSEINYIFDGCDCTVLECMIALAIEIEKVKSRVKYGNRTGQWFWSMIASLGLGYYDDNNFLQHEAEEKIFIFLNRLYEPNGAGGLFTFKETDEDMREVEIWYQALKFMHNIE